MRVRIIPDAELDAYANETRDELREKIGTIHETELNIRNVDDELDAFREESKDVKEIILPQSLVDEMTANGLTVDEVVSMIVNKMGKAQ